MDAVEFRDLEDWADVGVLQGRRRAGLGVKTLQHRRLVGAIEQGDFDRHLTLQLGVYGQVNRPHRALTENLHNPVAPEVSGEMAHTPYGLRERLRDRQSF